MQKDQKIFKLLSLFSGDEMKRFGQFVSSPYFNRLTNVTRLFSGIKKYHPSFTSRNLTSENLFQMIFPDENFSDSRIRSLLSHLYSLAEKFIASEKYFGNKIQLGLDIIEAHRKRINVDHINKSIESAALLIEGEHVRDYNYFEDLHRLYYEKNHLGSHFKLERDFQKESDFLSTAFIIKQLRIYSTFYNATSSLSLPVDDKMINAVESLALLPEFSSIPAVRMNYLLYRITRYLEAESFDEFISGMDKYPEAFNPEDLYQAHILFLNFCVIKIREGHKKYIKIKFELYKNIVQKELWKHEKYLSYTIFNNIVTSANENNEHAYAMDFIKNYSGMMSLDVRDNITHFCYAKLYYSLTQYDDALEHLSKTGGMEDIFYKFAVKDLNIKIFYESDQFEHVITLIDTYRHLLAKSRIITKDVKDSYRTYLNFLTELLKLEIKSEYSELKQRIDRTPGFVNKDWLIKMLGMRSFR